MVGEVVSHHYLRAANAAANRGLRRIGLELRALQAKRAGYYSPPDSCQVRGLASLYELFFGKSDAGLFVEVGAFDGISFSNTSCLAEVGWTGLLIEPVPAFAALCRARYAHNPRVQVVEVAAGATSGEIDLLVAGTLTTANAELAAEYSEVPWAAGSAADAHTITVAQRPLDDILSEAEVVPEFEVLVVDVEGYEHDVFKGFDVDRWRPALIIAELAHTHPDLKSTRRQDLVLSRELVSAGYDVCYKDSVNTIFARADHWDHVVDGK